MRTYSCDRCGCKIGQNMSQLFNPTTPVSKSHISSAGVSLVIPTKSNSGEYLLFGNTDLCLNCLEVLAEWMADFKKAGKKEKKR